MRYEVGKMDLVSDHLSTRYYIYDTQTSDAYDVRHLISKGYEVQYDTWAEKICEKLNEQDNTIESLKEENEQLKKEIGNLEHTKDFCAECCERLEKENEELKSEIREVGGAYEQLWMRLY